MLFNLFSKKLSQEEIKTPEKLIQQELKEERVERMVTNFERRIKLLNFFILEAVEIRNKSLEKGDKDLAARKQVIIDHYKKKLVEVKKEFQKEILDLTA